MRSIITFLCLLLTASSQAQTFSVLHRFARDGVDGEAASTTLTCSSNMLIGITARGGINGGGILYKVTTNGSSYQILHQFAPQGNNWFGGDLTADGSCPVGGLAIDGETIYGATQTGGGGGSGSIYKVKTDGSSYGILHSFLYAHEGSYPGSGLILEDGLLYGSCMFAGMDDRPSFPYLSAAGIHYGIHTNGSGYHIRGTFQKYPPNPVVIPAYDLVALPTNALLSTLCIGVSLDNGGYGPEMKWINGVDFFGYGGAPYGALYGALYGANGAGGFFHYHYFAGGADGAYPSGAPLMDTNQGNYVLYGATTGDGTNTSGTLYSFAMGSHEFKVLHTFMNQAPPGDDYANGFIPVGRPALIGDTLYGVTRKGGAVGVGNSGSGTIYQIKTDGTGFKVLHTFDALHDGGNPISGLLAVGTTLYGTTTTFGSGDNAIPGNGTVFKLDLPAPPPPPVPPSLILTNVFINTDQIIRITNSTTQQVFTFTNHISVPGLAVTWKVNDGMSHTLLQSANPALPVGSWVPVEPNWTNQMDVGRVLKPNPVDPPAFFRLKSSPL